MTESVASFNVPDILEEDFNNILYVDDEDSNLRVFDSVFSRYYNVFTANNGKMAIKLLHQYDIHMIITDQKMPEMTGTDLLEQTLGDFPDVIRIILTGFADIQAIIKAINKCSIYKYVTKPYENAEIKDIIDKGLELYNMRKKKYNGSPFFAEKGGSSNGSGEGSSGQSAEVNTDFSEKILADIRPEKAYYELFLENGISYQFNKKTPVLFKDFYIHSDEESVKLYNLSYALEHSSHSAMIYMHLKLKLRDILEKSGNDVELLSVMDDLSQFYQQMDESYKLTNVNLMRYDWSEGKIDYLTKEPKIRLYSISHQFEEVRLSMEKNIQDGYQLYSYQGSDPLMIYGWDYQLKNKDAESDLQHNLNQIIANATSLPFDMQENQITKGIESISKDFNDFIFYGLHITE